MLQVEIDNLNNEEWQHLLGQYFHTVYSHSNVDNDSKNDVNFSQGLNDEMINSTSKSVTADDLNHKTISTRNGTNKVNPTIVFPDNNEK